MAMRAEERFVARLSNMFGEPTGGDKEAIVAEYENALRGPDAQTFAAAGDHLARTHKVRCWPTIAECFDAIAVAKRKGKRGGTGLAPIADFQDWWKDRLDAIGTAPNEGAIKRELDLIDSYATARLIMRGRPIEAARYAMARRAQLKPAANVGPALTDRITGERVE